MIKNNQEPVAEDQKPNFFYNEESNDRLCETKYDNNQDNIF